MNRGTASRTGHPPGRSASVSPGWAWVSGLGIAVAGLLASAATADPAAPPAAEPAPSWRAEDLPAVVRQHPVLFVTRHQYAPDHHNTATFFPKARTEYNDGRFAGGSALKVLDLAAGGTVRTLFRTDTGVVRDPEVHFEGQRILFSLRQGLEDSYHLYEIQADGTGLRQLTFAEDVDDFDPLYLPDDRVVFSSTREPKYCMCNRHLMANLYRMEADGANIHQIGKSTLFEGHPALLPDGRILYDRWEYVDRNFGDAQALWTVNPDGTGHALYWGNNTASPGAVLDGRPVPGTEEVLCIFGSCHDRPWGALALVDRRLGLDGRTPVLRTWPEEAVGLIEETGWERFDVFMSVPLKYEDPYPLDARYFLAVRQLTPGGPTGIYLLDREGPDLLLHAETPGCFDPMPLGARPRPPVLPERRDFENGEGTLFVADVYAGQGMAGVPRGTVKSLRVIESPEKRQWTRPAWNGQGQAAPAMNWHDFNNKRILGTVPVEADGSAAFRLPADTFVYFQLLDERGMMVQTMRSGTQVQSGEVTSCTGCHEDRRSAPPSTLNLRPLALARPPSPLEGWHGPPRMFNFRTEVQPVLDRHCVRCHDFGQEEKAKVVLAGDRDLVFNAAYNELWRRQHIQAVGAGPADRLPPYTWGAHRSPLLRYLGPDHYDVRLSPEEFDRVVTWMDINAPYYPSYASAYPANLAGRSPLEDAELARLEALTGVRFRALASFRDNQGPQISFDRPERSPCLARIEDRGSAAYVEALALIERGRQRLAQRPEADDPAFVACELDQWRDRLYGERLALEQQRRAAVREGRRLPDR